jgi:hypothetical protein
VQGGAAGGVLDLVAAAGAGGGDQRVLRCAAHGGEKHEFADLLGDLEMLLLVPKEPAMPQQPEGMTDTLWPAAVRASSRSA